MKMKHISARLALLALLLVTALTSCRDKSVQIYEANVPVFQSWEDFRATTFAMEAGRDLRFPGKIYIYQDLLLVNEIYKGVHFFNNANPSAPTSIGFLPVHGCMDMAVRNNILYVDNYTDLVAFDISDPAHPVFQTRYLDAFNPLNFHLIDGYNSDYPMANFETTHGVVTGWNIEKVKDEVGGYYRALAEMDVMTFSGNNATSSNQVGQSGKAGSLARFALHQDHLYTLESTVLTTYNVSDGIVLSSQEFLTRTAETLFPYQDKLFIGTTTGLLIYSISTPGTPSFISSYSHVTACDPVVVENDRAYVTLRTGNACFGEVNALEVIDLSNIAEPVLLHSFSMTNPRGLGIDANLLFLCDGQDGLKVFDRTDEANIPSNMLAQFSAIQANDVIPFDQVLILTSEEGIFQYSYADPQNITQLSFIPVIH